MTYAPFRGCSDAADLFPTAYAVGYDLSPFGLTGGRKISRQ